MSRRGAELQPGRAGSALRLRSAGVKRHGPPPVLTRAHVGLCAPLSAFAEPWPRWAYRPSRARAMPGAGAAATAAAARVRVPRSPGSEPPLCPRTLGPTSFILLVISRRARWSRSSPRCAHPTPQPPSRARSDLTHPPDRSGARAPASAPPAPSALPSPPLPCLRSRPCTCPPRRPPRRPRCARARWSHVLVGGSIRSYLEGSCEWSRQRARGSKGSATAR